MTTAENAMIELLISQIKALELRVDLLEKRRGSADTSALGMRT